jgi:hypothetical protein
MSRSWWVRPDRRWPAALLAVLVTLGAACGVSIDRRDAGAPAPDPTADATRLTRPGARALDGHTTTTAAETTTTTRRGLARDLGEDLTDDELVIPPEPPVAGSYQFIATGPDGPVSFNACRTVRYVVRVGPGPSNGVALIDEAFRRLGEATGLRFVNDGTIDDVPTSASFPQADTPMTLAEAFTPLVVGWAHQGETDLWAEERGDTLGVGGPRTIVFDDGKKLTVSGFALLLPSSELAPDYGPGLTVGNVLLHELGHVIGLDHVTDRSELMQAHLNGSSPAGFGPGDLRGLWELGASRGCASTYLEG